MLASEFRFLGWTIAFFVAFAAAIAVTMWLAFVTRIPANIGGLISLALLGCAGFALLTLWMKSQTPGTVRPPARYAPLVLDALIVLGQGWWLVSLIREAERTNGHVRVVPTFLFAGIAGVTIVQILRRRYRTLRKLPPPPEPAFRIRRVAELEAAYALPEGAERRLALRPLHRRGTIRIALILVAVILTACLEPSLGLDRALLVSFGSSIVAFLALRVLIDV